MTAPVETGRVLGVERLAEILNKAKHDSEREALSGSADDYFAALREIAQTQDAIDSVHASHETLRKDSDEWESLANERQGQLDAQRKIATALRAERDAIRIALHAAEAIGDFSSELRDRRVLQERANQADTLAARVLALEAERDALARECAGLKARLDDIRAWWKDEEGALTVQSLNRMNALLRTPKNQETR